MIHKEIKIEENWHGKETKFQFHGYGSAYPHLDITMHKRKFWLWPLMRLASWPLGLTWTGPTCINLTPSRSVFTPIGNSPYVSSSFILGLIIIFDPHKSNRRSPIKKKGLPKRTLLGTQQKSAIKKYNHDHTHNQSAIKKYNHDHTHNQAITWRHRNYMIRHPWLRPHRRKPPIDIPLFSRVLERVAFTSLIEYPFSWPPRKFYTND